MNENKIKNILSETLFGTRFCETLEEQELVDYFYDEFLLEKLLIGEPVTIDELRDILNKKVVNFEFIKLDGDVRPARGTTKMDYIPPKDHPTGLNPSSDKVATFYDLTKGAWRSVSNRSKEAVLVQDEETGKLKVQVSDKKPKEKEYKPSKPKEKDVDPRPVAAPSKPIVKPSIRPEQPELPTSREEIPEPELEPDKPLNIQDPNITADNVRDEDIIVPGSDAAAMPELPEPEELPDEILPPKEDITFPEEEQLPPEDDITFPEDDEEEVI
jgi:hypothetical protein